MVKEVQGAFPVIISITKQPRLQISAEIVCPVLLNIYGAI